MINLIRQEFFKISKKRSTIIIPFILVGLMFLLTIIGHNSAKFLISSAFGGFQWSAIIIIVISATIIADEFQYGTIKQMIYQVNSRATIYFAKLIVIVVYTIWLHIIAVIFTFGLKWLLIGPHPSFASSYVNGMSLGQGLLVNSLTDILGELMIISMVFCIACITNNGASAISLGIVFAFIGQGIANLLGQLYNSLPIEKWNVFNMLNITNQILTPSMQSSTHLTFLELLIGNIAYTILFIIIGVTLFSKRKV